MDFAKVDWWDAYLVGEMVDIKVARMVVSTESYEVA